MSTTLSKNLTRRLDSNVIRRTNSIKPKRIAVAVSLALAMSFGSAHAVLQRAGPVSIAPSVGGFPAWYQDASGLTLEFCDPQNAAETLWCLLPGDVAAPEVFPTNFFIEHFYSAATAVMVHQGGASSRLVLALESSFANNNVALPGDQITFARIRVSLNPAPATGTYRFIHPYGEELINAVAGQRIFFTNDVGIGASGDFSGALNSRLGPFLTASNTPGGAELPAVPGPGAGKLYLADAARIGPVTGSTLPDFIDSTGALRNHNIFRIEGPVGSGLGVDPLTGATVDYTETTNFALQGRVFTGTLPSQVKVDRASYTRDAVSQKVDVFVNATETTQGRIPGQPRPPLIAPQLTFYDAPCAGTVDLVTGAIRPPFSAPVGVPAAQMFAIAPGIHWGQTQPAVLPTTVCVEDASARDIVGNIVPVFIPHAVTDEVTVSQALFDPGAGTLTVAASSSDTAVPPTLTLAYGGYSGALTAGQIVVPGLIATPASVQVLSSAAGSNSYQVSTTIPAATPVPVVLPVAVNDAFTFLEDAGAQSLTILANDNNIAGGTVTLTSAPRLGTALFDPVTGTVSYVPNLNANGTDQFTYTVTVGTTVSNTGTVTLNITPVNDAPTAVNDSFSAIANTPIQLKVLANDTDPDGAADIVNAVNVTTPVGATVSVIGGIVTFNATASGTYTFTYQAQDQAGVISANTATVTVQVAAVEALNVIKAEYVRSKGNLRAQGTITPAAGQTLTLAFVNSAGTVLGAAGSALADAAGNWAAVSTVALPTGTTAIKVTSSNGTVRALALAIK